MEITWLGYSSFRIKGKDIILITDPFPPDKASAEKEDKANQLTANILTVSHNHLNHNYVQGIGGNPVIINGPGEYEVADALIWGHPCYHDSEEGKKLGKNTLYVIHWEELTLCHMGDIGHVPEPKLTAKIGSIDILMVPVGSGTTLKASLAAQVVRSLEPKIVIPMHFRELGPAPEAGKEGQDTDTVTRFLAEMGSRDAEPQPRFNISHSSLPDKLKIVLLKARARF